MTVFATLREHAGLGEGTRSSAAAARPTERRRLAAAAGAPAYFTSDNNLFYSSNTASFNYGGTAMNDSVWQVITSQDSNSVVGGDPMFVNPLNDLHVMGPGADNTGTPLGLTTDIDGDTRSTTTPDIGADEYTYTPMCFAPTGVTSAYFKRL